MSILSVLQVLINSTQSNVPKHDLRKKPTSDDAMKSLNEFLGRNFYIICVISILFLLIMFVIFYYILVGVSAMDSGNYYYHLMDVI